MASDKGAPKDGMDERLAQVRDAALCDGEEIVAQEMGDQGQAIVVTNSRILIIKAGLTATGVLNGQSVGAFSHDEIKAVNVRKGPMGAVIQVCVDGMQQAAAYGTPNNVIVFSGNQRSSKCDALAEKIESTLGRPVERFGPKTEDITPAVETESVEPKDEVEASAEIAKEAPRPMKGGRQAKSLAEEMFEEMIGAEPETESKPVEAKAADESVYESVEELRCQGSEDNIEKDNDVGATECFRPNPNLPKPVKKDAPQKSFVLMGGLMALVLIGMAVISPLRNPKPLPKIEVDVDNLTRNAKAVHRQIVEIDNYRDEVARILKTSDKEAAALSKAVCSGQQAIVGAAGKNASYKAWRELTELKVPSGLADAQESLALGAFTRKSAVANALSVGPVDVSNVLGRLREADILIKRGLDTIDKMEADLDKQSAIKK